jgi:uncharacterized protein (DUF1330 family)
MKKAYWVGIVNVKKKDEYQKYVDIAGPALLSAGAIILSRGGRIKNLEGRQMDRVVVIQFPSMDQAEKFYHSEEYKKGLKFLTSEVADRFLNIAEGLD